MHALVYYNLYLLLFARIVAVIITLEFYVDTKKERFKYYLVGWLVQIAGNIMPLLLELTANEFLINYLLLLNALLISTSVIIIATCNYDYFFKDFIARYKKYFPLIILLPLVAAHLLFLLIPLVLTRLIIIMILNGTFFLNMIIPIFRLKVVKERAGKAIRWYYALGFYFFLFFFPVSIFFTFTGEGYGLYESTNVVGIMVNYLSGFGAVFIMIFLMVQYEYSLARVEKNNLKDRYTHDVGNILQVLKSAISIIRDWEPKEDQEEILKLAEKQINHAADLIKKIKEV